MIYPPEPDLARLLIDAVMLARDPSYVCASHASATSPGFFLLCVGVARFWPLALPWVPILTLMLCFAGLMHSLKFLEFNRKMLGVAALLLTPMLSAQWLCPYQSFSAVLLAMAAFFYTQHGCWWHAWFAMLLAMLFKMDMISCLPGLLILCGIWRGWSLFWRACLAGMLAVMVYLFCAWMVPSQQNMASHQGLLDWARHWFSGWPTMSLGRFLHYNLAPIWHGCGMATFLAVPLLLWRGSRWDLNHALCWLLMALPSVVMWALVPAGNSARHGILLWPFLALIVLQVRPVRHGVLILMLACLINLPFGYGEVGRPAGALWKNLHQFDHFQSWAGQVDATLQATEHPVLILAMADSAVLKLSMVLRGGRPGETSGSFSRFLVDGRVRDFKYQWPDPNDPEDSLVEFTRTWMEETPQGSVVVALPMNLTRLDQSRLQVISRF